MSRKVLHEAIMEAVENQIETGEPPETKETLDRLLNEGYSNEEAKKLIGSVVAVEIFEVMKQKRTFDRERFVGALKRLPEPPYHDGECGGEKG
mgnify:CR=1 FL=1